MPGSETALEEFMCRLLGHLLEEGMMAKLADDLYFGVETLEELTIGNTFCKPFTKTVKVFLPRRQ